MRYGHHSLTSMTLSTPDGSLEVATERPSLSISVTLKVAEAAPWTRTLYFTRPETAGKKKKKKKTIKSGFQGHISDDISDEHDTCH